MHGYVPSISLFCQQTGTSKFSSSKGVVFATSLFDSGIYEWRKPSFFHSWWNQKLGLVIKDSNSFQYCIRNGLFAQYHTSLCSQGFKKYIFSLRDVDWFVPQVPMFCYLHTHENPNKLPKWQTLDFLVPWEQSLISKLQIQVNFIFTYFQKRFTDLFFKKDGWLQR